MSIGSYLLENPASVVALVASTIALFSLRSTRHLTKAKHTLDFDKDFKVKHRDMMVRAFIVLREVAWADRYELGREGTITVDRTDHFSTVAAAINVWESVAIGIKNDVYLEQLLYEGFGSTISQLYLDTIPFIKARQQKNPRLFTNFVWLGVRWTVRLQPQRSAALLAAKKAECEDAERQIKTNRLRSEIVAQLEKDGWKPPTESAKPSE